MGVSWVTWETGFNVVRGKGRQWDVPFELVIRVSEILFRKL